MPPIFKIGDESIRPIESTTFGAQGVDELRVLCNAIKHSGHVSSNLARYPGWVERDKLQGLAAVYERLAPESDKYIAALVDSVKEA